MDSNKQKKEGNEESKENKDSLDDSLSEEFPATSPLDASWSSDQSLKSSGGAENVGKRQRTGESPSPSRHRTPSPAPIMVAASPPKFVSLEHILKAADGVKNMTLAHEIAVDNDFKLEKMEISENSINKQVRDVMHQAFWDALSEKLQDEPPDYSHALVLLQEVKENLLELLLPQQKFLAHIEEVLDLELLQQKVEHEAFDFRYYADFVIDLMSKLCAPVRDEEVAKLREIQDIVTLFKEIFRVLDLLKMDMANFTIQQMRPFIQQQSVEYERKKFGDFLKTQEENNLDGLLYTKQWLTRTADKLQEAVTPDSPAAATACASPMCHAPTPSAILNSAYTELLQWKDGHIFPETLIMDQARFLELRDKTQKLALASAILLVTYNTVGEPIAGIQGFKEKLKDEILIIFGDTQPSELKDLIVGVGEQINKEVNQCLATHGFPKPDTARQDLLKGQIKDVLAQDHPVHKLVRSRLLNFVLELISTPRPGGLRLPPGLSSLSEDLSQVCGQFLRLVSHNRAVFGEHYANIIEALLKRTQDVSPSTEELD